jgi:NAD(P)-dependent dehydrogenase (short-subunit alcohol dehydrogenase family)
MQQAARVALVTGANRGIGLEIASRLAGHGLTVVLGARDAKSGKAAAAEVGGAAVAELLDVTDAAGVERAMRSIDDRFGRLDVLVNNAGILIDEGKAASTVSLDLVAKTLETNFLGAWRLSQAVIPRMRRGGYGRIVNVSSGMGTFDDLERSGGGWPAYRLSKAALDAMTILLASELRAENILVNAAIPGWVRTRMGGASAPGSVEQGADTAVWLAMLPDGGPSGRLFQDRKPLDW